MANTNARKICIFTGTRAEYGLLFWLMKEIEDDPLLELQIVVSGSHLSSAFGNTYKQIEKDGFRIDSKVDMLLSSDTPVGITKSMGLGLIGIAGAIDRLKPDILVVLGDRYEAIVAAQVALILRIPIAHIHGGELTEGAFDDSIRHAITKMSSLHFTSTEDYRKRVIQLGEAPDNVYNVGAPGLDNIARLQLLSKGELEERLDFRFGDLNFLVTFHPETLSDRTVSESIQELLHALDEFNTAKIIFTKANADTYGAQINNIIEDYCSLYSQRTKSFDSLGQVRYLSCLKYVDVVLGNSSSGIIEVPMFHKPTVNIGNRQKGRIRSKSVIDCECKSDVIANSIRLALTPSFQSCLKNHVSIYGEGNASVLIKNILKDVPLDELRTKSFYDIPFELEGNGV